MKRALDIKKCGDWNASRFVDRVSGQAIERRPKIQELHMTFLGWTRREPCRVAAFLIAHLMTAFTEFGIIFVTKYRIEPGDHIGTRLERSNVGPGLDQGFLHEILGAGSAATERY